jgi:hypothetical protein
VRLFKVFAPLVCLFSVCAIADHRSIPAGKIPAAPRAMPGPMDVVYAMPGDLNYSYGASGAQLNALMTNAVSANIVVTYTGFTEPARAAFQAAVNIWANIISSPATIRINARFADLGDPNILGSAGPTVICGIGDTYYAAALADKLHGSAFCASLGGQNFEINANLNNTFTNWDFGTTGTAAPNMYNFMTVVLHELGHGLGFFGLARASSLAGDPSSNSGNPCSDTNPAGRFIGCVFGPHIYDRFVVTGSGATLLGFGNPSEELASRLVANDMFFNGANARSANGGQSAKIETHNFTTSYDISSDHGWLQGSSYSHLDDVLYTGTPNGLMTFALHTAEVYTDPGPIVRGMFQDEGWTLASPPPPPPACTYAISPTSLSASFHAGSSSVAVTTAAGCAWTATSNSSFLTITGGASGTGNGTVTFHYAPNTSKLPRSRTLTIAGRTFTVNQSAAPARGIPDVDGDGYADLTVFRPGTGEWFTRKSSSNYSYADYLTFQWGIEGDLPLPADFDGDGAMDLTVFRPSTAEWFVRYSSTGYSYAFASYQWGLSTDIPLVADFDGDGRTDLVVYRPSTGEWFVRYSSQEYSYAFATFQWGVPGDQPVVGDFDGDGRTDLTVYRPSSGEWLIRFSSSEYSYSTWTSHSWGLADDVPLPADFDGDGRTDLVIYRPSDGNWYVRFSTSEYSFADWTSFQWGVPGDTPLVSDFDGDGRTDLTIFRPSSGEWFVRYSSTGYSYSGFGTYQWAAAGDVPIMPR